MERDPTSPAAPCAPVVPRSATRAGRARDVRLRAEGIPRRDAARAREYERERSRGERAARKAAGICTACGTASAAPGRVRCEPCLEKRRAADRAKYAAGKAAGLPYGGSNIEAKRRSARARSKKRQRERIAAGLCIRCGVHPPAEGGATCLTCRDKRQAAERQKYEQRRAAGLCTRCGGPAINGLSRCTPCAIAEEASHDPERKNARSRKLYAERKARGLCTSCGAPSQGASRCAPCAERSYHASAHFRGIPVWDPTWTVIELDTGRAHGPFDSEADVALCLVFEKLDRDRVEIVTDASPMASMTSWS